MALGVLNDPDVHLRTWRAPRWSERAWLTDPSPAPQAELVADSERVELPLDVLDASTLALARRLRDELARQITP